MNEKWTDEELDAAVLKYVDMLEMQAVGKKFNKKQIYSELAKSYGRSEKAWEYRMQNISFVYYSCGRGYVQGLKPAKNVGGKVLPVLEKLIHKRDPSLSGSSLSFDAEVARLRKKKSTIKPNGNIKPNRSNRKSKVFDRDPQVVAWLLENSAGKCECCRKDAPFIKLTGEFYLEVHHLKRLADGGTDTITNAIAICPNCHRELHYGLKKDDLLRSIYQAIPRLMRE